MHDLGHRRAFQERRHDALYSRDCAAVIEFYGHPFLRRHGQFSRGDRQAAFGLFDIDQMPVRALRTDRPSRTCLTKDRHGRTLRVDDISLLQPIMARPAMIALCRPDETVLLVPEPTNKHDPSAVALFSLREQQIGYLSADRCGWIGSKIRLGEDLCAIFQEATKGGALIRVSFTRKLPALPPPSLRTVKRPPLDTDDGFYPNEIPPDD